MRDSKITVLEIGVCEFDSLQYYHDKNNFRKRLPYQLFSLDPFSLGTCFAVCQNKGIPKKLCIFLGQ